MSVGSQKEPAIGRGMLRAEFRRARMAVGLTQREVAGKLGWSLSKVIRIESGHVGVSQTDTKALLDLYEVNDDEERVQTLISIARDGRRNPWSKFRGVLNPDYVNFLGYEESAIEGCYFEQLVIPGILQAEGYAQRLIESFSVDVDAGVTEQRVEARLARSQILDRSDGPSMTFIIAEHALRGWVGNPGDPRAQREQLELLLDLNELPNVDIYALPYSYGSHPGMITGFALLRLPDQTLGDVLFQEFPRPSVTVGASEEFGRFRNLFASLREGAKGGAGLVAMINSILDGLPEE